MGANQTKVHFSADLICKKQKVRLWKRNSTADLTIQYKFKNKGKNVRFTRKASMLSSVLQWMAFTSLGVVLVSTMTFVLGTFPGMEYSDRNPDPNVLLLCVHCSMTNATSS